MSHKIYPAFTTEDTLTQLVTKLVTLTDDVAKDVETIEDFDSDISVVFNASTGVQNYKDNVTVNANNGIYSFDSDYTLGASSCAFTSNRGVTIDAGDEGAIKYDVSLWASKSIVLRADNDLENVILKSGEIEYGSFVNNDGNLTIKSGLNDVIILNGTSEQVSANFQGEIGLPDDGPAAPDTTSKTVAGAINELRAAIILLNGGSFPQ